MILKKERLCLPIVFCLFLLIIFNEEEFSVLIKNKSRQLNVRPTAAFQIHQTIAN